MPEPYGDAGGRFHSATAPPPPEPDARAQPSRRADFQRLAALADYWLPLTLRAVADLGVADALAGGPKSADDLAAAVHADAGALRRALRALVAHGVFAEPGPGVYAQSSLSELLRTDDPESARATLALMPSHVQAWALVRHSLETGQPSFALVHGRGHWEWIADHPEENDRFNEWMQEITRRVLSAALPAYDWPTSGTIVDVGGGTGELLAEVLAVRPEVRGVCVDLPHVVSGAAAVLEARSVRDRCELVGGSFFDEGVVPRGASLYVLKAVLHNWADAESGLILRRIADAARPDSRVLVIDAVIPEDHDPHPSKLVDLNMMVLLGSRERTEQEFSELFAEAGLRLTRVLPASAASLIEAVPAPS